MQILTKDKCVECEGSGVVYHPAWHEFNEIDQAYKKEHGNYMEMEQVEEWFRNKGYSKLPPEEPECSECYGLGEIQRWMDIKEVLELANIIG